MKASLWQEAWHWQGCGLMVEAEFNNVRLQKRVAGQFPVKQVPEEPVSLLHKAPLGRFPSPAGVSSSASPYIAFLGRLDSVEFSAWMWATEQNVFHLFPDRPLTGSGCSGREMHSVHDTNCFSFQTLWWYFLAQDFRGCWIWSPFCWFLYKEREEQGLCNPNNEVVSKLFLKDSLVPCLIQGIGHTFSLGSILSTLGSVPGIRINKYDPIHRDLPPETDFLHTCKHVLKCC